MKRKTTESESSFSDPEDLEEPSLITTDEEISDIDAECFYCSGLYTTDRQTDRQTRRKVDQMHKMLQVVP